MILAEEAAQTNTMLIIGAIGTALGGIIGALSKFAIDFYKERNKNVAIKENAVIIMLKEQVAKLERECKTSDEKLDKLLTQQVACEGKNAELRVKVEYLEKIVAKLEKENLHLSSPEIILPPPSGVKLG